MNDRVAAAQMASVLLVVVALLLAAGAARRPRCALRQRSAAQAAEARPLPLHGGAALAAWLLCALPVLLGFVLPVAGWRGCCGARRCNGEFGLPLERFAEWAWSSFRLAWHGGAAGRPGAGAGAGAAAPKRSRVQRC
jgi:iron(III) transport system permease protein